MKITPDVFEAYLKCPTKCWLRSTGEPSAGATYPEWVKAQNNSYRKTGTERLLAESPKDEVVLSPDTPILRPRSKLGKVRMRERFRIREITVVADRGMVSQATLEALSVPEISANTG
jgi:hypothetical protein